LESLEEREIIPKVIEIAASEPAGQEKEIHIDQEMKIARPGFLGRGNLL